MPASLHQFASRTQHRARAVLLSRLAELRPAIEDQAARELLTDELATEILETAWSHQFDDDRQECRRKIREMVEIAIEARDIQDIDAATQP